MLQQHPRARGKMRQAIAATFFTAVALICLRPAAAAPATAQPLTLLDLRKEVSLSSPQFSPDGSRVVLVVTKADFKADQYDSELWIVDVASATARALTHDRKSVDSPLWSPAGDRIAFIAPKGEGEEERDQVYVMPMDGGDPRAITDASNGVEQFAWSPDGKRIAYVTPDDAPNKAAIERHDDGFEVRDGGYLDRSAPRPSQLWLIAADGGEAHRLTSGPTSIAEGNAQSGLFWSHDGRKILAERLPDAQTAHDDQTRPVAVDVQTGAVERAVPTDGWASTPVESPDGSKIAYPIGAHGSPYYEIDVDVASGATGSASNVTRALDRSIQWLHWMPDGKQLLVSAHDGTASRLWLQPAAGGSASAVPLGDIQFFDGDVARNGAIALIGSNATTPDELYLIASPGAQPRRLTHFNDWIAGYTLGAQTSVQWRSPDGFSEDGVLIFPPNFDSKKRYPLVLSIHGGPQSASLLSFHDFSQTLAARGWLVFQPNYRGSDDHGDAYMQATIGDVGPGPGRDILAGVTAVENKGFVDASRIGISGWSEGGCLTSWLVTQSHIWKAAVVGAGVTNWVDEATLSDSKDFEQSLLGGSPWIPALAPVYARNSAITYVRQAATPTLILSDTGDYRVPSTESFEFYHGLKDNHVETRFVELPRSGHFPSDPVGVEMVYDLWSTWFEDKLK